MWKYFSNVYVKHDKENLLYLIHLIIYHNTDLWFVTNC